MNAAVKEKMSIDQHSKGNIVTVPKTISRTLRSAGKCKKTWSPGRLC